MTGIVWRRIWSGSLFRSELFGAQRGSMFARLVGGEQLMNHSQTSEFQVTPSDRCTFKLPSQPCRRYARARHRALPSTYHNTRLNCYFKSEQVIQRNKLQQKHLPMPTLVNCSPARDWVISIHFKFYRLRDVRSFVDKCLTGTPGTPLKVFSWIISVYIRKCLLVSLREFTYSVISFHRGVCSKWWFYLEFLNR